MIMAPDAATAAGYGARPAPRQLRLISWKPVSKGALRGFATIDLLSIGLRIYDVPVFAGSNGPWAALPSKPELDRDGRRKIDINGKATYTPVLEWRTRELGDKFAAAVVSVVRQAHPDDLAE
jgi:hypothetical protein